MMAEFMVNTDMFGMYVRIPTGYSREMHVYKVVSKFKTNSYCDVPIVYGSKPVIHEKEFHSLSDLEDVLNVIHCGIDETEVIRVALKDCEIVTPTADVVPKSESLPLDVHEALKQRAVENAKAKVVREIFEEIDTMLFGTIIPNDCAIISTARLAELKKKYTEGNND